MNKGNLSGVGQRRPCSTDQAAAHGRAHPHRAPRQPHPKAVRDREKGNKKEDDQWAILCKRI
ncbi:MAG: hypothetical protein K6E48_00880 [Lachnospiraceae bacterium]|nr:hypothetical protein [Lachnospiraceae bacterium]